MVSVVSGRPCIGRRDGRWSVSYTLYTIVYLVHYTCIGRRDGWYPDLDFALQVTLCSIQATPPPIIPGTILIIHQYIIPPIFSLRAQNPVQLNQICQIPLKSSCIFCNGLFILSRVKFTKRIISKANNLCKETRKKTERS